MPAQKCRERLFVQASFAELAAIPDEHGHALAVARFERVIAIHADDLELELAGAAERFEALEHFLAEMAAAPAIQHQSIHGRHPSQRRGDTIRSMMRGSKRGSAAARRE